MVCSRGSLEDWAFKGVRFSLKKSPFLEVYKEILAKLNRTKKQIFFIFIKIMVIITLA
jgi:hypothetical protein